MLDGILEEVNSQPDLLGRLARRTLPRLPADSLLVGAGDSYIAAQCASLLSSFHQVALDPYVLIASPDLCRGRTVAFLSVSGRTRSNIAAARKVKGVALRSLCVTANADSPLAETTGAVVPIPYEYRPRVPGTLSFTLMLACALKLASVHCDCGFQRLFERAKTDSSALGFSASGTTFFLGNHSAFPAALYAASKTYEFFGGSAQAELLEEFSHLELFSLKKRDSVNIFRHADPSAVGRRLTRSLTTRGFKATQIQSGSADAVEGAFHAVFAAQHAVLSQMRARGLTAPYFMRSSEKLGASDDIIY